MDALAGLRPALLDNARGLPGVRVLDGRFTAVQQAIGCRPENRAAIAFLEDFVAEAKRSGLVQRLIDRHGVTGRLQVAAAG
jgi:polar amino acid transport system substrate-binding protein